MNASRTRGESTRCLVPRRAAASRRDGLANWLALLTLLALGIVWQ